MPIAIPGTTGLDTYTAPVVGNFTDNMSDVPALWGSQSQIEKRVVPDFAAMKAHLCGKCAVKITLPEGSTTTVMEQGPSKHAFIPCTAFEGKM